MKQKNELVAELEKIFAEMTEPEEIAHAAQRLMACYLDDENSDTGNSDNKEELRRENLAKAEDFYWENVAGNEEMPTSDTRYFVAKMLQYALKHGFLPEAERFINYYVTDLGYPAGLEDFLQSDEWQFHQNMFRVYITMNHPDEAEKELETLKSLFASALKQAENAEDAEEADIAEMEAKIEAQVQEADMEINAELRAEIEAAIKAELEAIQKENALFRKADLKPFAEEMGKEFDAQGVQILILRGKYDDALTKIPTLPEKRQEEVLRMLLEQRLLAEGLTPVLESARKIPSPTVRFNEICEILEQFYLDRR
ncbi:MAG: hypothetical protein Q4C70_14395 [Planctomycetia bacterium]|nr:hypothetical protein [Planctomycetia bacterium]